LNVITFPFIVKKKPSEKKTLLRANKQSTHLIHNPRKENQRMINRTFSLMKKIGSPHSCIGDLGQFWVSCLGPLVLLLPQLNYLAFQYFDIERT
jgi:hypothetical protein